MAQPPARAAQLPEKLGVSCGWRQGNLILSVCGTCWEGPVPWPRSVLQMAEFPMACWAASPSHSSCPLLLGDTSPAVRFAAARKREFLNYAATINKESMDDYFLCLITFKYTVTKIRLQTQKLQWSDFPEPVLLSSLNLYPSCSGICIFIYCYTFTTGPQPLSVQWLWLDVQGFLLSLWLTMSSDPALEIKVRILLWAFLWCRSTAK